ncbi:MAG: hypothetical protein R3C99_11370 [Pirellulaceae bacterium]
MPILQRVLRIHCSRGASNAPRWLRLRGQLTPSTEQLATNMLRQQ